MEVLAEGAEERVIACPNCGEPIRDPAGYQALLEFLAKRHNAEDTASQRQFPNAITPSPRAHDEES